MQVINRHIRGEMTRAVVSDTRPATKRKTAKAGKMPRKRTVRRRDSFAVALRSAQYRKRVVGSAKAYSRKAKPPPEETNEV
jgi:hypothetical protein